jgi:thymidylate synthase (FAD)
MPISIHRQLERHRVGTAMNSESTRYSEIREEFYVPEVMRGQSRTNKQGSEGACDDQEKLRSRFTASCRNSFIEYARLLRYGVAREQARDLLPLATYTSCIWTASLMAVAHFINLRDDDHAQPEIRAYAQAMRTLAEPIFPISLRELCKGTSA